MTRTFVTQDGTRLPRRMSMTPLGPRELGGLKGFGFTVHCEEIPVPHLLAAADGRPSTPSDPDAGVKSGGIPVLSSDGAAVLADMAHREGSHAVTHSEPVGLVEAAI